MNNGKNLLIQFLVGVVMLVFGLYWFTNSVAVTSSLFGGFGGVTIGGFRVSTGLILVPFIIGIVMLFFDFHSILAKLVTGIGFLVIIAAIIASLNFHMRHISLYELLVMLVLIFGGLALVVKVLFSDPDKKDDSSKKK